MLAKGESAELVLQSLSRSLSQKMLHGAYHYLRNASEDERQTRQDILAQIFPQTRLILRCRFLPMPHIANTAAPTQWIFGQRPELRPCAQFANT